MPKFTVYLTYDIITNFDVEADDDCQAEEMAKERFYEECEHVTSMGGDLIVDGVEEA